MECRLVRFKMNNSLEKIQQIIDNHYQDNLFNYTRLCQLADISRSHLYRLFKEADLPPPSIYIRDFRLEKAKGLLLTTDLTVSEIAFKVGYKSLAYFSDSFSQVYGLSPTTFREKNR